MMEHVDTPRPGDITAASPISATPRDPDEIPFADLARAFRRHAIWLALVVVAVTAATLCVAYLIPKRYTAMTTLLLVPQSTATDEGEIGSITSRLAAIASTNLNSDPKKADSLVKLESKKLLERYITENNLIPILFPDQRVSLTGATEYFDKQIRKVISDPKTGFVDLTVSWKDPVLAARWANGLVATGNDMEREIARAQSLRTIEYLKEQSDKTDDIVTRHTLNALIATELKKSMVAQGTREFSYRTLDPAVAPEKYTYPNKMTWLLTACAGSFSISIFVLFCLVAWRKDADLTRPPRG